MASSRQINANRRNAQKSTGPKTAAGKARSSKNGLTHGFYTDDIVLPGEEREAFEALVRDSEEEFSPATPTERELVHTISTCRWRLQRLVRIETGLFAQRMRETIRSNEILNGPAEPPETLEEARQETTKLLAASWIKDAVGANSLVKFSYHESRLDRKLSRALQRERRAASAERESEPAPEPCALAAPPSAPRTPSAKAKKLKIRTQFPNRSPGRWPPEKSAHPLLIRRPGACGELHGPACGGFEPKWRFSSGRSTQCTVFSAPGSGLRPCNTGDINELISRSYSVACLHLNHFWVTLFFVETLATRRVYREGLSWASKGISMSLILAANILIIWVIVGGPA